MKKLIIAPEILKRALSKLSTAVNPKSILPALENVYFRTQKGNVQLTASDLEITIRYNVIAEVEEEFEFMVSYHILTSIIKLCGEQPITFEVKEKSVKILTEDDVFDVKFNAKLEDFPKFPRLSKPSCEYNLDNELLPKLSAALDTISKNEVARPQLGRVALLISKNAICIASTDAHNLYSYEVKLNDNDVETELLLSPRMVKALEGMAHITVTWDDKKFAFQAPEMVIVITRPDYKFPNYKNVIPEFKTNLKISRSDLQTAFQKCNLSSDKIATVSFTKKKINIKVDDKVTGLKIDSSVACEYSGEVDSIMLSTESILKTLHQVNYNDIELAIIAPNKSVLITSPEDGRYLGLVQPSVL